MLNWAIIGSGDVVERLVQKSFNIKNKSKVKYIYSIDKKNAHKISKKFNYGAVVNSYKDILKDKSINCLYVTLLAHYIKFFQKILKISYVKSQLASVQRN